MSARQTRTPQQWLIADQRLAEDLWPAIDSLPRGAGILFLFNELPRKDRERLARRIRGLARSKQLSFVDGASRQVERVHDLRELRRAMLSRAPLILLSPIFATRSHPGRRPLPRMSAAALARLSRRRLLALGGMDARRFRRVQRLGFIGWAGIDAFRT